MTETTQTPTFKPKKSVALSGVAAGNTELCTVGRTGNDLSYRGYDILDLAQKCEFEEVAHLLIHGHLPNKFELAAYKTKLKSMRGLPIRVIKVLESLPAHTHPMDVMRTGVSMLGCVHPERESHPESEARDIADKLIASLGSILLYWYQYSHNGKRIEVESDEETIGGHFLHLLHGKRPSESHIKAMHVSLILYAEHEFNASTFTARVIAGTGSDMYSLHYRCNRCVERSETRRCERSGLRYSKTLPQCRRSRSRYPRTHRPQRNRDRFRSSGVHHFRPSQRCH